MLRSIVHFFIAPSTLIVLSFLILWAYAWQKSRVAVRRFLWLLIIVPAILLGFPIAEQLIEKKERQFPVLDAKTLDTSSSYVILVLGAGKTSDPELLPTQQINSATAVRLLEGCRIYRQLPHARMALSGAYFGSHQAQAEVTAEAALALGVDPQDTLQLRGGMHTQAEIEQVARRIQQDEKLIVVSSAVHLPRVHFWLSTNGLMARLAPAYFLIKNDPSKPQVLRYDSPGSRIKLWHIWWHETLGLWHGRWIADSH